MGLRELLTYNYFISPFIDFDGTAYKVHPSYECYENFYSLQFVRDTLPKDLN
jgi:hypothetical protein